MSAHFRAPEKVVHRGSSPPGVGRVVNIVLLVRVRSIIPLAEDVPSLRLKHTVSTVVKRIES